MAYLNLGTGLAAGIVLGRRLWRGVARHRRRDRAHPGRPGRRRCARAASAAASRRSPRGSGGRPPVADRRPAAGARALRRGRRRRPAARDRGCARLVEGVAAAVRVLVLTVDVDTVVIGGGLSRLGERLLGDVRDVLDDWARDVRRSSRSLDLPGARASCSRTGSRPPRSARRWSAHPTIRRW